MAAMTSHVNHQYINFGRNIIWMNVKEMWRCVFSLVNNKIMIDVLFQSVTVTQAYLEKEIRVLLSGVEPKTIRLLVRMLYH